MRIIKKFKVFLIITVFIISFVSLFTCYNCVAKGVTSGLYLCMNIVIPTLFPVLCVTGVLSSSGVLNLFANHLESFSKKVFNTSGYFIPVFLLSLVSGYPVGACISQTLYEHKKISLSDRNNIASVCCSAGPGFVLLAVGIGILNSYDSGVVLLISHILSTLTVMLIVTRFFKASYHNEINENNIAISDAFVGGVQSACNSTISICAYTIIFSAVVNVISKYLRNTFIYLPLISLLEVTNAVYALSGEKVTLPIISAVVGFGGFSIVFQICSALKNNRPPFLKILFIRLTHAFFSAFYCKTILLFYKIDTPVSRTVQFTSQNSSKNFLFSLSLFLLLIVFLNFFNKCKQILK